MDRYRYSAKTLARAKALYAKMVLAELLPRSAEKAWKDHGFCSQSIAVLALASDHSQVSECSEADWSDLAGQA